jgi:hypothetical protein
MSVPDADWVRTKRMESWELDLRDSYKAMPLLCVAMTENGSLVVIGCDLADAELLALARARSLGTIATRIGELVAGGAFNA